MISFVAELPGGEPAGGARAPPGLQAEQRQADVERLYALSQEMMLFEDAEGLIRDLPRLIDRIFALEAWCFTSRPGPVLRLDQRIAAEIQASLRP